MNPLGWVGGGRRSRAVGMAASAGEQALAAAKEREEALAKQQQAAQEKAEAAAERVLSPCTACSPVGSSGFTGRKRSQCAIASSSSQGITTTGKQGKIIF